MTVNPFALLIGAYVVDRAACELAADVFAAMKRADLSQDYVARVIGAPHNKLSEQLHGKAPFTLLWRILANSEIRATGFWAELLELQAERLDRAVVRADVGHLIAKVEELIGNRAMVKAQLPAARKEEAS